MPHGCAWGSAPHGLSIGADPLTGICSLSEYLRGDRRGRNETALHGDDSLRSGRFGPRTHHQLGRSEEHTSELQSLMRISYAVFCLKKKRKKRRNETMKKPRKEQ